MEIKKRLYICFLNLIVLISIVALFSFAQAQSPPSSKVYKYIFGGTIEKSWTYATFIAQANAINEVCPNIRCTMPVSAGFVENAELITRGNIQVANISTDLMSSIWHGTMEWEGRANKNLRVMTAALPTTLVCFATKKSGVTNIEDLNGKPFGHQIGSASARIPTLCIKANEVNPKWFEASGTELCESTKMGRVLGYCKAGAKEATLLEIALMTPIYILAFTDDHIAKGNKKYPGLFKPAIIPAGEYPGQEKDVQSLSYVMATCARKEVPEEVVYCMIKGMYQKRKEISKTAAGAVGWLNVVENTLKFATTPLHPGAVRFYKELGYKVPDELIPPEMK